MQIKRRLTLKVIRVMQVVLILFCACFMAAGSASGESQNDVVIGEVDGEQITLQDFQDAAAATTQKKLADLTDGQKLELLDKMIADKLLYKEALKKGVGEKQDVMKSLERAKRSIVVKYFIDQEINSRIPPASPEELAAYYEIVKGEYAPPDKAKITTIYVFKSTLEAGAQETKKNWGWGPKGKRVDEEAKKVALEIKNALSQGQDAEAIVQHYRTLDKDKTPWIDQPVLQELPKGTFYRTSNFDEILFNLKDGEAGVFELPERYMVFRMIAKTPGTVPPLKEIEPAVSARLHQETLLKNYKEYIANLQKEAKITVKREYMK
jgi:hypothetical protein